MKKLVSQFILLSSLVALILPGLAQAEISDAEFAKAMDKYLASKDGAKSLGSSVETYFKQRQQEMRKEREQQAQADMEQQFKNPVKVAVGTSPTKGPKNAPVTIIEFSDFQCPYCSRANATIEQVVKEYGDKVQVAFKHLPLPFHKQAEPAAKASLAAAKQGKFWEMHDALFKNQRTLAPEFYEKTAKEIGLDVAKFKKDMESDSVKKQIEEDKALAQQHGISGTPGFFVNGVAVKGALPFDHFKTIIDRWLEIKKQG